MPPPTWACAPLPHTPPLGPPTQVGPSDKPLPKGAKPFAKSGAVPQQQQQQQEGQQQDGQQQQRRRLMQGGDGGGGEGHSDQEQQQQQQQEGGAGGDAQQKQEGGAWADAQQKHHPKEGDAQQQQQVQQQDGAPCGSCYGAEAHPNACCNTCEEVREAYRWVREAYWLGAAPSQACGQGLRWDGGRGGCRAGHYLW